MWSEAAPAVRPLLAAARYVTLGDRAPLEAAARDSIDWADVFRAGRWHGLLPLLHTALEETGLAAAAGAPGGELREAYCLSARRNLHDSVFLVGLLSDLHDRGIAALLLKGAVLANTVYRNPAHREYSDIDVLIRPSEVERAHGRLQALGFHPWPPGRPERPRGPDREKYARQFDRPRDGTTVDLHWALAPATQTLKLDAAAAFASTERVEVAGRPVHALDPELQLIALCVHGAKHNPVPWPKLKWMLDVAELIRARPDLSWPRMFARAAELGCGRMVRVGLRLAEDVIGVELPRAARQAVRRDGTAADLAARVRERVLTAPDGLGGGFPRIDFDVRIRDRRSDRLRYSIVRALSPSTRDRQVIPLPRRLAFLYYPVRIGRLGLKYLLRPARLQRFLRSGKQ